jgi:hypothetical protein
MLELEGTGIFPIVMLRYAMNRHYETVARFLDPVDPVVLIPKASPGTAIQMHSATEDMLVPTGQLLFDAANEPKEIYWYDATHTSIGQYKQIICERTFRWFEAH